MAFVRRWGNSDLDPTTRVRRNVTGAPIHVTAPGRTPSAVSGALDMAELGDELRSSPARWPGGA